MASLNCILHPHHVSLMRNPSTIQSLLHSFEDRVDPYYGIDGSHSHKGLGCPRFNVVETETAFLLDGEFPGVVDSSLITIEWLRNQVLIVEGVTSLPYTDATTDQTPGGEQNGLARSPKHGRQFQTLESAKLEAMVEKPVVRYPRQLLSERQIGGFQRSFTFQSEVDADDMKATLANGLLRIIVPKILNGPSTSKKINIV